MAFALDYRLTIALTCFVTMVIGIITYYKWAFKYWKNRGVWCGPTQFPFGSMKNPLTTKLYTGIQLKLLYDLMRSKRVAHGGIYLLTAPLYVPVDPQLIKSIVQQDFQHFVDRGFYYNEKDDPLSANLFALGGERWRTLRTKVSTAFTPGKIRTMFDILLLCGNQMQEALSNFCGNGQPIDIKDVSACYTIDIIGSYGFGIECNSFKYPDAEFRKYAKTIFAPKAALEMLLIGFAFAFHNLGRWLGIKLFRKDTTDFFIKVVGDTVKLRETQKVVRNDLLQLLIELRNQEDGNAELNTGLTIKELAAQVFIFFAAGFETSSTTMTFCLYELAINPDLQQKVKNELDEVLEKHEGQITYDAIMDLKYMSQVVDETLRKYPPVAYLNRKCVKDYKVPGTDVVINKGMQCVVSVLGLHHDPTYYPDPDTFDPERFSAENKQKRAPFTYMPFGEGPRICIGLRLGLLQVKVGLAVLLKQYKFSLNEKTVIPFQMDPNVFTMVPTTDIFLNITRTNH